MEIKVNVVEGATIIKKQMAIPKKSSSAKIDTIQNKSSRHQKDSGLTIRADSLLFLKYKSSPNKSMVVSIDPVHQLTNKRHEKITFIIDAMGYTYSPDKSQINYFNKFNCNKIQTNKDGIAYLWVDGRFIVSKDSVSGTFNPSEFGKIQCHSI